MIYYICPKCRRRSDQMELSEKKYIPTEKEHLGNSHIESEMLECPCGLLNTWFTLIETREHSWQPK